MPLRIDHFDLTDFYSRLADRGLSYGPAFQTVKEVTKVDGGAIVRLPTWIQPYFGRCRGLACSW